MSGRRRNGPPTGREIEDEMDAMLDGMEEFEREVYAPVGAIRPTKLRYTHEAMIDMIIAEPGISQNKLAAIFGYTTGWLSTVMGSDAFKAKLAERRGELVDPVLKLSIDERFRGMVEKSLEVLQEKLSQPALQVPDQLALRAAELGAKALGMGGNQATVIVPVQQDHLEGLAGRLLALQSRVSQGNRTEREVEGMVVECTPARPAQGELAL